MVWEFRAPEVIVSGTGTFRGAGVLAAARGGRALIVSDPVMERMGRVAQLSQMLQDAGVGAVSFTGVPGEPTDAMVAAGVALAQREGCDLLVSLGGGSPMDTAKAIAMLATNGGRITEYMGQDKVRLAALPHLAIPTTGGTGSEVTKFTIITDHASDVKMLIGSPHLIPTVAIVDPELTLSAPPRVTADTGVDALTHAIEAYISRKAQPMTDVLALSAIRLIAGNLRQAWANGQDLAAREAVMMGAMQAGLAFTNASVALVHGMSRPIGALFHVPHGLSNAMLLPTVMAYTWPACPQKFKAIAAAMGEPVDGLTPTAAAKVAVDAVRQLCQDLQIPTIASFGIPAEQFMAVAPKMAEDALISGSPANNPRTPNREEITELYRAVLAM
ncbi:MAG: dhaT 2 [Firmicutes bacterium]|nr:dhaT 2 [Bacillota bacterium]